MWRDAIVEKCVIMEGGDIMCDMDICQNSRSQQSQKIVVCRRSRDDDVATSDVSSDVCRKKSPILELYGRK